MSAFDVVAEAVLSGLTKATALLALVAILFIWGAMLAAAFLIFLIVGGTAHGVSVLIRGG